MAITASYCKRNGVAALTMNDAAATQSIGFADKPGEKIILVVDNQNTTTGQTATITISKGDYLANEIGNLVVDVAKGAKSIIGPVETVRFKNTASEVDVAVAVTASGTISNVKLGVVKLP